MTMNPGSREARVKGCVCPVMDNAHGRGYMGTEGEDAVFVQRQDCPLHGWTDRPCGNCGGDGGCVVGEMGDTRWASCEACRGTGVQKVRL